MHKDAIDSEILQSKICPLIYGRGASLAFISCSLLLFLNCFIFAEVCGGQLEVPVESARYRTFFLVTIVTNRLPFNSSALLTQSSILW